MTLPTTAASSLFEHLRQAAQRNPAAPAFIANQDQLISHGQWWALVCALTLRLHGDGLRPGQRIGLRMGNSPLHCAAAVALSGLGAVSVPLPGLQPAAEMARLAQRLGLARVLADGPPLELPGIPVQRLDEMRIRGTESEADFPAELTAFTPTRDTALRYALTSGTTGEPRAVLQTHGEFLDRSARTLWGVEAHTRLLPPQLHLTIGLIFALGVLGAGGCVVFPRTQSHADHIAAVRLYGVSHWLLSPAAAADIAALLPPQGQCFPSLRHLRILGARPSAALLQTLRTRFSPNVFLPYGLTELGVVSLATPGQLESAPESAGSIQPWAEVQVLDATGQPAAPGVTGELRLRVQPMPRGYEGDEEATALRFREGWFHPGDLGHIGADGLLRLEGRVDDLINTGGEKILPGRIEHLLMQDAAIREAVVFALDPPEGRSSLGAAVLLHPGASPEGLAQRLQPALGLQTAPNFFVMRELPRNASGKVLRGELPALARQMMATAASIKPAGARA